MSTEPEPEPEAEAGTAEAAAAADATVLHGLDGVRAAVGHDLGASAWIELTQDQIDLFHQAVGASAEGNGDAPPLLILALTNLFMPQIVEVRGVSMGVNYGTGAVRFPATVAAGARLRGRGQVVDCDDIRGGVQTTIRLSVEVDGRDEPACVVDALSRWIL
jgi:acyl dehydratase